MAARFWVGLSSNDWNLNANWSATSGGAGGVSFPTVADDVTLDANSNVAPFPDIHINVNSACKTLTCTNYNRDMIMDGTLSIAGNITLGSAMTFSSTNPFIITANCNYISNGKTLAVPLWCKTPNITINIVDSAILANGFTCYGTQAQPNTVKSNSSGVQRVFTVLQGGDTDIDYCNATDLDSSAGLTCWTYKGVITNSLNWKTVPLSTPTTSNVGGL